MCAKLVRDKAGGQMNAMMNVEAGAWLVLRQILVWLEHQ